MPPADLCQPSKTSNGISTSLTFKMLLLTTLFLAQALAHHAKAPTPAPSPEVRITIVNATSVPAITLTAVAGGKGGKPMTYPSFLQGSWTGNEPLKSTEIEYSARTTNGSLIAEHKFSFQPVSSQILLITGDLSTSGPQDELPSIGAPASIASKPTGPNLQFRLYPAATGTNDLCRYRVVNAMPSKLLILRTAAEGGKPSQQLALLAPGNSALFVKQPPNLHWEAVIDGQTYPLDMQQEEERKNCLIPFFLRKGIPSFLRVFENP